MATLYTRTFNLKDSLSDADVLEHWRFLTEDLVPVIRSFPGTVSAKAFSGAGALRADISFHWEMDDASVYEKALLDADLRGMISKAYADWDLSTAGQSFRREVTAELIQAIGGKG
jgi:hypothetical protein